MGGFTLKLMPFFSGNVGENGIKRENGQDEENYSLVTAVLHSYKAPQYPKNQVQ